MKPFALLVLLSLFASVHANAQITVSGSNAKDGTYIPQGTRIIFGSVARPLIDIRQTSGFINYCRSFNGK